MKATFKQIIPLAALLALSTGAFAQGPGFGGPPPPGGFGGPGGGGFQMPPEARAKMQAWRKWRDSHKNVSSVQRSVRAISALEQDPRTKLTKPQARAILGVLKAWRNRPVMTDAQARQVNQQITAPLSIPQLKKLATLSADRRGGPGGGPGGRPGGGFGGGGFGGGRPGGGPGGGPGGRPGGFDPSKISAPHDYNPLNPSTLPFERQRGRAQQELDQLVATLSATAR
ncbi:hypothetical protein CCAX7_18170 [Capsulimonas corticalis]|uniref:Uncharacterized protein n=1 Tax=Capsulimonas corticalis TaxID=2219043 RepID=A0A402D5F2_9BACT|nr:hypothetical protein [Capsulimonas corticalis]BDI29766.1 hypothetical protein CCAX7_18170 [Capsulimonas corticalis]